jgi:hypothetical protein
MHTPEIERQADEEKHLFEISVHQLMKTISPKLNTPASLRNRLSRAWLPRLLPILMVCSFSLQSRATLPAPDNLLYGFITINGRLLTPADTNFAVEAAASVTNTALATYRMGENSSYGSNYVLKIQLEELAPVQDPKASLVGDTLVLTIRSNNIVVALGQAVTHLITERGLTRRIDIVVGAPPSDSDHDGLPDAWELAHFGSLTNGPSSDPNHKGVNLFSEFIAGTDPNNTNDVFKVYISQIDTNAFVSFFGRLAQGAGYEGMSRHYALESSSNVTSGFWSTVPGYTNVLGDNSTITHTNVSQLPSVFYRARVWLETP